MALIQFKFFDHVPAARRARVLRELARSGFGKAAPAFPAAPQSHVLAAIYNIDGVADDQEADIARQLGQLPDVEFAEVAPERLLEL